VNRNAEVIPLFCPVRLPEMEQAALDVMRSGQIAAGPLVDQFEAAFGAFVGREHVVCTNDMTSALVLALRLAGVRRGDEVATLAFSCLSSNSAIAIAGAKPLWIDIDPATMTMSPDDLAAKLSPATKAVTLYHVAGYPGPVDKIAAICRERGIPLIEDCNAAVGASMGSRRAGHVGTFSVYSFYPNRQINALEGGALICPDAATAQRARRLRRFGIDLPSFRDRRGEINPESDVPEIGLSASFSQLNAAIALAQLPSLSGRLQKIQNNAKRLGGLLAGMSELRVIDPIGENRPAYWGLMLDVEQRDDLLVALKAQGIQCSALHQRNDGYTGFASSPTDLEGTAHAMARTLAIPCGWWLEESQIDRIASTIREMGRALRKP
jgi:dTDP-4-amino-4,6-dideoxygalactose transaminase